jgi:hypothetical protein
LQDGAISTPIVKFSEFLGIGYFGDEKQNIIAPIFDLRNNAERGWTKVMENQRQQQQQVPLFHTVFVEHPTKYEFITYPVELKANQINYAIYRSFSSLTSLHKFKSKYRGRAYIKFGWHDLTKAEKFDVLLQYAVVDFVEFKNSNDIKQGMLIDQIRRS